MLGFMAREFFRQSPVLMFPLIALAIFMTVFIVIALRAVVSRKQSWDAVSRLPLESDAGEKEVRGE